EARLIELRRPVAGAITGHFRHAKERVRDDRRVHGPGRASGRLAHVVAVEEQVKPAADDHRLVRLQLSGGQRLANRLEEVLLAGDGPFRVLGGRVGGHAGGATKGRHFAAVRLRVLPERVLEQRVPALVPRLESGGRGELVVEPAGRDESVVVRGGRRRLDRALVLSGRGGPRRG